MAYVGQRVWCVALEQVENAVEEDAHHHDGWHERRLRIVWFLSCWLNIGAMSVWA